MSWKVKTTFFPEILFSKYRIIKLVILKQFWFSNFHFTRNILKHLYLEFFKNCVYDILLRFPEPIQDWGLVRYIVVRLVWQLFLQKHFISRDEIVPISRIFNMCIILCTFACSVSTVACNLILRNFSQTNPYVRI